MWKQMSVGVQGPGDPLGCHVLCVARDVQDLHTWMAAGDQAESWAGEAAEEGPECQKAGTKQLLWLARHRQE